jgi:Zinc carboxypeptidase/Chitobiase/beta-hexosaminidase C-terminal domain
MTRRRMRLSVLALVAGVLVVGAPAGAQERSPLEALEPTREVRLKAPGSEAIDAMNERGYDLAHDLTRVPDGVEVDAVVTQAELAELEALGVTEVRDEFRWSFSRDGGFLRSFGDRSVLPQTHEQSVRVVRADYFTTKGQGFLYVEARTTEGAQEDPVVEMQLENDTGPGTPFAAARTMSRFVDSGEYMFHRNLFKVAQRPYRIRVTSSTGGVATGFVSDWLRDVEPLTADPAYESDFVDGYKHPQQLYARFEEIAEQNPEIAEIVELPYQTNGYQRKAQATIGGPGDSAVVMSTAAWGHEGGNDVTVEFVDQPGTSLPLSVEVSGKHVRVLLAKDASGAIVSTAAEVAAALESGSQGLIDRAHPYRDSAGTGVVAATPAPVPLTDFLDQKREGAPAGEVPRGPATIRVLRIGKERDGSKPGVLIQAQDHAREWVPATITLETAERLVANYDSHPETRRIVEDVDIFLIPSNNPDGSNFSFYNFALQRKNMTNHCPDANADPGRRNSWGVDLNRNYRVGSGFDGYAGASTSCTSGTYQGPSELSEPESRNIVWLVERYPNIKFMMSVHSNGGQLFWQPGAYIAEGRITTPRPPLGHEAFYWQSADRILSHVRAHRQTVVTPENVGGSSDVLYSSAGNVREDMYHTYGVFSFGWEVGGSVYNPETGEFQDGSFQPPWESGGLLSGHDETLEYTNGVMEMFRIAREWGLDKRAARSGLIPAGGTYRRSIDVRFETTEPATIYYTTDGSRPTLESPRYEATEFREPGETLHITETTTFKWFSVDAAGNVERNYDPTRSDSRDRYQTATIKIRN